MRSVGRAQHFGKGTGAFEPSVVLCTLLAEKRFSPAPRTSSAGDPREEGELVRPRGGSWFRKGEKIPGM